MTTLHQIGFYILAAVLLLTMGHTVRAQTMTPAVADETFDLNITLERINEVDFERSTNVAIQTGEVRVQAGAVVTAERIVATLTGVTGSVRFRASLEPVMTTIRRFRN